MARRRVDDGQRPLPFKLGLPAKRRTPAKRWKTADGQIAKICPACGCTQHAPCIIMLEDGESSAHCTPAGVFGQRVCSACKQMRLPFETREGSP